jgi:hypothetical protein
MSATLTIELSQGTYEHLRDQASEQGKTPEALAAEYLERCLPMQPGSRLRRWAGAFDSGLPDVATRHHDYLGQALADELRGKKNA